MLRLGSQVMDKQRGEGIRTTQRVATTPLGWGQRTG